MRTKPGPILAVKEKEKLLNERITFKAEEYVCPTTGDTKLRTVEYIEKVIEKEVWTRARSHCIFCKLYAAVH